MHFYSQAPIWENQHDCPNTTTKAVPMKPKAIRNKRAIHIKDGHYRGSTFTGRFYLGDEELYVTPSGKTRVNIQCCWFGHRLETRGLAFTVDSKKCTINEGYSGTVFTDFGFLD